MSAKTALLWLAAAGVAAALLAATYARSSEHVEHRFESAEEWAPVMDDPARDAWQKPDEVIRALALAPDAVVADIGAGTGYFAVPLARAVPRGRVFAADIEPDMVRYLKERAEREGLSNLGSHRAEADDPRLPARVDLVLLVAVYHHIDAREEYFRRVQAALNPGGRLAVIDGHRIPPEQVKQELARAGFELAEEHSFLPDQYFLVFRPEARK